MQRTYSGVPTDRGSILVGCCSKLPIKRDTYTDVRHLEVLWRAISYMRPEQGFDITCHAGMQECSNLTCLMHEFVPDESCAQGCGCGIHRAW